MAISAAAAVYVGGTAYQASENRKAADAADRSAQENLGFQQRKYAQEKQMADVSNIRSMRQSIRAARLASATMVNTAANKGGVGGSGVAGGVSAINAQSAGNINYMMTQAQTNATINTDMLATAGRTGELAAYGRQSSNNAQVGAGIASIGSMMFSAAGGPAAVAKGTDSIFSGIQDKIIPKSPYW
jgi:hypothetical protein